MIISFSQEVKAAKYLTPVTLELGGKSPCIIDETANIKLAAKRIIFGKLLNVGQTCVAPDYIYCHEKIHDQLIEELIKQIKLQYSNEPLNNPSYGKIINQKHFIRLQGLMNKDKIIYGGKVNEQTLQIEPTIMDNVTKEDLVMKEEIFGPILPIMTYHSLNEVLDYINDNDTPLALYFFSKNKKRIKQIFNQVDFGGGCINDVIIHLATTNMGFGGFKESGIGKYHGYEGYKTFSHEKGIVDKKMWIDLNIRYQPYKKDKIIHFFLK